MKILVIGLLIGLVSGAIAALCGVGGGLVMVPLFTILLGLGQKQAVATSLAVIVPTALVATGKNIHSGLIDWPVFAATSVGACVAAFFMAEKLKTFQDATLTRIFAAVLILMGGLLWFRTAPPAATPKAPETSR